MISRATFAPPAQKPIPSAFNTRISGRLQNCARTKTDTARREEPQAGADEHWKTARTALSRIDEAFARHQAKPHTFFIGGAIESKMAGEIWRCLESGVIENAANLTDDTQMAEVVLRTRSPLRNREPSATPAPSPAGPSRRALAVSSLLSVQA